MSTMLDVPCFSARDLLALVGHVRDTKPRHPLRAIEDALLDLVDKAETGPNCRTCGRTKAACDAEPRHCCPVCDANGHG